MENVTNINSLLMLILNLEDVQIWLLWLQIYFIYYKINQYVTRKPIFVFVRKHKLENVHHKLLYAYPSGNQNIAGDNN